MTSAASDIEALLFDLGGVMFGIDFERALQHWAGRSALAPEEFRCRFSMDEMYERHERGEIGASEYFTHLRSVLEIDATDEWMAEGWNAIYLEEIAENVEAVLRARSTIPCFAFTDTNSTHQRYWTAAYPRVVGVFERVFVSSELGLRKPEHAAFQAIVDATGFAADRMLFFDDSAENTAGAEAA